MDIGVVFPQTEIGPDRGAIRGYATGVEAMGYRHLIAYDHVLGADPTVHVGWTRGYTVDTTFHEPFVLFGYLAGLTSLEFATGILILPQRQTALVAKQAAQVDILCGGKFRLGVGVGWNKIEYDALGFNFSGRGRRIDEQIPVLRRLWSERTVSASVENEHIVGAGIAPLPIQRPIPIWMGADSPRAFRRVGRLADGWFPQMEPGPQLDEALSHIADGANDQGRDAHLIGMNARVHYSGDVEAVLTKIEQWCDVGASHVSVNTMMAGLDSVHQHLEVLEEIASARALKPQA